MLNDNYRPIHEYIIYESLFGCGFAILSYVALWHGFRLTPVESLPLFNLGWADLDALAR